MSEIRSHTALRGVAALLVIIFHYRIALRPAVDLDAYTNFFAKGYLWVDLFFMLSGLILYYVYDKRPAQSFHEAAKFLMARFARIYPLHLATLLFITSLIVILPIIRHQLPEPIVWPDFWLNLFDIHAWGLLSQYDFNFPSWSISVEFAAYLLFPILCLGLTRFQLPITAIMTAAVAARLMLPLLVDTRSDWERIVVLQGLPMFMLGVILCRLRRTAIAIPSLALTFLQLGSIACAGISMHYAMNDALASIAFAALVFATQTDGGVIAILSRNKISKVLGDWSYSIYMLHIPSLMTLQIIWPKLIAIPLGLSPGQTATSLAATSLALTILAGWLSFRFFEMPARRKLFSIYSEKAID